MAATPHQATQTKSTAGIGDSNAPLWVNDLTVAYHRKPVLWDIDLNLPEGRLIAVVGPNGAGKSTFIKSVLGLVPRASGAVTIYGKSYEAQRHLVGYVPQRESVDWDFPVNALDVVAMGLYRKIGWLRPVGSGHRRTALDALEKAIAQYRGEAEKPKEGEIVCECFGVTDIEVSRAVKESNLRSVEEITNFTKAGGGCGKCEDKLRTLLLETVSVDLKVVPVVEKPKKMTALKKIKKIEEVLEREIRPELRKDDGDIELIDVDGDFVTVSLRGACTSCTKSETTLKEYVEKKLRELVLDTLIVEEDK